MTRTTTTTTRLHRPRATPRVSSWLLLLLSLSLFGVQAQADVAASPRSFLRRTRPTSTTRTNRRSLEESLEALYVEEEGEPELTLEEFYDDDDDHTAVDDGGEGAAADSAAWDNDDDNPAAAPRAPEEETTTVVIPPSEPAAAVVVSTPPEPQVAPAVTSPEPAAPRSPANPPPPPPPAVERTEPEVEDPLLTTEEEGPSTLLLDKLSMSLTVQRCLLVAAALVGMLLTAHQVGENPDGCWAATCRATLNGVRTVGRILTCCGCGRRPSHHHHHVPVATLEYGYRVNTEETVNFK